MKYALSLATDCHILSVTYEKYATINAVIVESLPDGDVSEYRYVDGIYIYDPIPEEDPTSPSEPDDNASVWDELDAAYQEGVDSV